MTFGLTMATRQAAVSKTKQTREFCSVAHLNEFQTVLGAVHMTLLFLGCNEAWDCFDVTKHGIVLMC